MIISKDRNISVAEIDGKAIVVTGEGNVSVNEEGNVKVLGLPKPASKPEVEFERGEGGLLAGTEYSYLFTYFSEKFNVESPASPATKFMTSNKQGNFLVVKIDDKDIWLQGNLKKDTDAYVNYVLAIDIVNNEYLATYDEWQFRMIKAYEWDETMQAGKFTVDRPYFNVDPDEDERIYDARIDNIPAETGIVGGKAKSNKQIVLDPSAQQTNYDYQIITIVSGQGKGQRRLIVETEIDEDTGRITCTVDRPFKPKPRYVPPNEKQSASLKREKQEKAGYIRGREVSPDIFDANLKKSDIAILKKNFKFYAKNFSSEYIIVDLLQYKGLLRRGTITNITKEGGYKRYMLDGEAARTADVMYYGMVKSYDKSSNKIFLEITDAEGAMVEPPDSDAFDNQVDGGDCRFRIISGGGDGFDAQITSGGVGTKGVWIKVETPQDILKFKAKKFKKRSRFVIYSNKNIFPDELKLPEDHIIEDETDSDKMYVNQLRIALRDPDDATKNLDEECNYAKLINKKSYETTTAETLYVGVPTSIAYGMSGATETIYGVTYDVSDEVIVKFDDTRNSQSVLTNIDSILDPLSNYDYRKVVFPNCRVNNVVFGWKVVAPALVKSYTTTKDGSGNITEISITAEYVEYFKLGFNYGYIQTATEILGDLSDPEAEDPVADTNRFKVSGLNISKSGGKPAGLFEVNSADKIVLDTTEITYPYSEKIIQFKMDKSALDAGAIENIEYYCNNGGAVRINADNEYSRKDGLRELWLAIARYSADDDYVYIKCHYSVSDHISWIENENKIYLHAPAKDTFVKIPVNKPEQYSLIRTITSIAVDGRWVYITLADNLPLQDETAPYIDERTADKTEFCELSTSETVEAYRHSFTDGYYTGWNIVFYDDSTDIKSARKKKQTARVTGHIDATNEVYVDRPPRGVKPGTKYIMWTEYTRSIGSRLLLYREEDYIIDQNEKVYLGSAYNNRFFHLDYFAADEDEAYKGWAIELLKGWAKRQRGRSKKRKNKNYYEVKAYSGRERRIDVEPDRIYPVPDGDEFVHIFDPTSSIFQIVDNTFGLQDSTMKDEIEGQTKMKGVLTNFVIPESQYISHIRLYRASESEKNYLFVEQIKLSDLDNGYEDKAEEQMLGAPIDLSRTNVQPASFVAQTNHLICYAGGGVTQYNIGLRKNLPLGISYDGKSTQLITERQEDIEGALYKDGDKIDTKFRIKKVAPALCIILDKERHIQIIGEDELSSDSDMKVKMLLRYKEGSGEIDVFKRQYTQFVGKVDNIEENSPSFSLANGIVLSKTASKEDDYYNGAYIKINVVEKSTSNEVVKRFLISDYDGEERKIVIDSSENPANYEQITYTDDEGQKRYEATPVTITHTRYRLYVDTSSGNYYIDNEDTGIAATDEWTSLSLTVSQNAIANDDAIIIGEGDGEMHLAYAKIFVEDDSEEPICEFVAGNIQNTKNETDENRAIARLNNIANNAATARVYTTDITNKNYEGLVWHINYDIDGNIVVSSLSNSNINLVILSETPDIDFGSNQEIEYTFLNDKARRYVQFSIIDEPEMTSYINTLELDSKYGADITGAISYNGIFYFFQQGAITTFDLAEKKLRVITDKIGAVAPYSITKGRQGVYFLDDSGEFWRMDFASAPYHVNKKLMPWFKAEVDNDVSVTKLGNHIVDLDALSGAEALFDDNSNYVFLLVPSENKRVWEGDFTITGSGTATIEDGVGIDDFYNDMQFVYTGIHGGNDLEVIANITDYDGAAKQITIDNAWLPLSSSPDAHINNTHTAEKQLLLAYDEQRDQWYRLYSKLFYNRIYGLFDNNGKPAVATPLGLFNLMSKDMNSTTEGEDWKYASQFITENNPVFKKHVKNLIFTNYPPPDIIGTEPTMTIKFRRNWIRTDIPSFQNVEGTRPNISTVKETVRPHAGVRGLSWQFIIEGNNYLNIKDINIQYRPIMSNEGSWA